MLRELDEGVQWMDFELQTSVGRVAMLHDEVCDPCLRGSQGRRRRRHGDAKGD